MAGPILARIYMTQLVDTGPMHLVSDVACRVIVFFFQAEDGIRDYKVTGVQTCALPIFTDTRLRRRQVLDRHVQVVDRVLEPVLSRTQLSAHVRHLGDRGVELLDRVLSEIGRASCRESVGRAGGGAGVRRTRGRTCEERE